MQSTKKRSIIAALIAAALLLLFLLVRAVLPPPAPPEELQLPSVPTLTGARRAKPPPAKSVTAAKESAAAKAAQNTAGAAEYAVITADAAAYQQLLDWAAANDFDIRGELPQLNALKIALDEAGLARLHRGADVDFSAAEDAVVRIPPQLSERYPPWSGDAGPGFGGSYRDFLGVDTADEARGAAITVALLDTPLQAHPALANADISVVDLFGLGQGGGSTVHGNAVASILTGEYGVTNARVLAYSVLDAEGSGSAFDVAAAIINAVDSGAKVISMSLGTYDNSAVLENAVRYAALNGALIVAAAGNNGVNEICYPAAYEAVIAVGAISADKEVAGFSNRGAGLTLAAPGVGLLAAAEGDSYAEFSGTSAAVPCVAGALANFRANNPALSTEEVLAALLSNCDDIALPGADNASGCGVLNAERLENFDQPGIYDAAAAGITLTDRNELIAAAQNTGTEPLETLVLTVSINGVQLTSSFNNVPPRAVVAAGALLPETLSSADGLYLIESRVEIPNTDDARPDNQRRRQIFLNPLHESKLTP